MEITINYWAVVVAGVANMVVGMLWYGPLFGKQWKSLMGFTDEDMRTMPLTMMQAMFGGLIVSFIMAFVLAHSAFAWTAIMGSVSGIMFALQLAFWIWLGYVATTQIGSFLWEGKPFKLFVLNAAGSLVAFVAMSLILVLWQ